MHILPALPPTRPAPSDSPSAVVPPQQITGPVAASVAFEVPRATAADQLINDVAVNLLPDAIPTANGDVQVVTVEAQMHLGVDR